MCKHGRKFRKWQEDKAEISMKIWIYAEKSESLDMLVLVFFLLKSQIGLEEQASLLFLSIHQLYLLCL